MHVVCLASQLAQTILKFISLRLNSVDFTLGVVQLVLQAVPLQTSRLHLSLYLFVYFHGLRRVLAEILHLLLNVRLLLVQLYVVVARLLVSCFLVRCVRLQLL